MDRKLTQSSPVQEALRPTHLSMRRELNCNRGYRNGGTRTRKFWHARIGEPKLISRRRRCLPPLIVHIQFGGPFQAGASGIKS